MIDEIRTICPSSLIKGSDQCFVYVPEFDMKHLKNAEGRIGRNIMNT